MNVAGDVHHVAPLARDVENAADAPQDRCRPERHDVYPHRDVISERASHRREVTLGAVVQPGDRAPVDVDDVDQPTTSTATMRPNASAICSASPTTTGASDDGAK